MKVLYVSKSSKSSDSTESNIFSTISEALAASSQGDQIIVSSGIYRENLTLDKDVEIISDNQSFKNIQAFHQQYVSMLDSFITYNQPSDSSEQTRGDSSSTKPPEEREDEDRDEENKEGKNVRGSSSGGAYGNKEESDQRSKINKEREKLKKEWFDKLVILESGSKSQPTIVIKTNTSSKGRVRGLLIRQTGSSDDRSVAISIEKGHFLFEFCDITSSSFHAVQIYGKDSNPTFLNNHIHDANRAGISFKSHATALIESNQIFCNSHAGIVIKKSSNPNIKNNKIRQGKRSGVLIHSSGAGVLQGNEIYCNHLAGIQIKDGGDPIVKENLIHHSSQSGIFVFSRGKGTIDSNKIYANTHAGIVIKDYGNPLVKGNQLYDGKDAGVLVFSKGRGIITENEIFQNSLSGIIIKEYGEPIIRGNRIHSGKDGGILVHAEGKGIIEVNEIYSNYISGIEIMDGGDPLVRTNNIHDNKDVAIYIHTNAMGTIEGNHIHHAFLSGIEIKRNNYSIIRNNRIHENRHHGLLLTTEAKGLIENNHIYKNTFSGIELLNLTPSPETISTEQSFSEIFQSKKDETNNTPNLNIVFNRITQNGRYGLYFENCEKVQVTQNEINKNRFSGIYLVSCTSFSLSQNIITENSQSGVFVVFREREKEVQNEKETVCGVIEKNEISHNGMYGLSVRDTKDKKIIVENNYFHDDNEGAILFSHSTGMVTKNCLGKHKKSHVVLTNQAQAQIVWNEIQKKDNEQLPIFSKRESTFVENNNVLIIQSA